MATTLKDYIKAEVYHGEKSIKRKFVCRYVSPNTNAVYLLRKSTLYYQSGNRFKRLLSKFYKMKLERRYGCFIDRGVQIGIGLRLPHPNGIIIGNNISIGENATIFQQVTIGGKYPGDFLKTGTHPVIGKNVMLFAGCKVLGGIKLADGTWVGANAVLTSDTIENYTYAGVPARPSKTAHPFFVYD